VENFQGRKTWCQNTTFTPRFTTNSPAIDHVLPPQIPATPLKNTSKRPDFSPLTTPEKKYRLRKKNLT
jgi:hypothetical protein